jgi:uncharacterized membrane protein
MTAYWFDWINLLLRWAHAIVGIAWIGASFYFIWLDNHLHEVAKQSDRDEGVGGELWAVHGGGFYHAQKYRVAPPELPKTLHWFKWEAYWTFITGFSLLVLVIYSNAELYLIDPAVMALTPAQAVTLGLAWLAGGWIVYDLLCRSPLGKHETAFTLVMFVLMGAAAWGMCQIFSGRGAFIHFGAMIGTIMVANVAMIIMPGQRELVKAKEAGRLPDPKHGLVGKQRSVHNTYFTLPALFCMFSGHYPMTFGSSWNWAVLMAISLAGALIRVWFVMRHKGKPPAWPLVAAVLILAATAVLLAPAPPAATTQAAPAYSDVRGVIERRCAACHADKPVFQGITEAPKGVKLDTPDRIRVQASAIHQQAAATRAMPPGNLTAMTEEERSLLRAWYVSGASIK